MPDLSTGNKEFIKGLSQLLRRAFFKSRRKRIFTLIAKGFGVFLFFMLFLVIAEHFFYLSGLFKTLVFACSFFVSTAVILLNRKKETVLSYSDYYHQLSRVIGAEEVRNVMDLSRQTASSLLLDPAIRQNIECLSLPDIRKRIRNHEKKSKETRSFRLAAIFLILLTGAFISTGMSHPGAMQRIFHFWRNYERPNPYVFTISPGNTIIENGSQVRAVLQLHGKKVPRKVSIYLKTGIETKYRVRQMEKKDDSTYVSDVLMPSVDTNYLIGMDGFRSQKYHIKVQLRPRFKDLGVVVRPPSYTHLDSVQYRYPFSTIDLYPGSEVSLHGRTNKALQKLILSRTQGESSIPNPSQNAGIFDSLATRFRVYKSDSLSFKMTDLTGLTNDNPFAFKLNIRKDQSPAIAIIRPETPLSLSQPDTVGLSYSYSDDFGFHSLTLHYELKKAYVKKERKGIIRLKRPGDLKGIRSYTWDLRSLDLKPLDVLTYWITIRDNDAVSGYKEARSNIQTIRMASLAETITDVDQNQSDVSQSLNDLKEDYRQLQDQFQKFRDNLRNNPQNTWQHRQDLKKITRQQKEMNKKVDEIKKKFDAVKKKLQKNHLVSKETLKKYDELKKLISQIHDPAILKALQKLQQSLNNIGEDQIRQALQNYKFNEAVYKERLQRTIELFKSLKLNAELENMARNLEALQKQEESLQKDTPGNGEQVSRQQEIQKNLGNLSKKLNGMKASEIPEQAKSMIRNLRKSVTPSYQKADQQIRQNIKELQKKTGDAEKTGRQQKAIAQQISRIKQQIQDAQKKMNQKRARINLMALKSILEDLMLLSNEQEKISRQTAQLPDGSQAFVEQARRQANVAQSYGQVVDSLYKVSIQVPQLSGMINRKKQLTRENIGRAQSYLADRDASNSSAEVRTVLGNINELSSMIASLIDRLQQGGQGGGSGMSGNPMDELRRLSHQQKGLNDQLQKLINDIQGNRLTEKQLNRFNQLARTQKQIRDQIQQLQRSGEIESGDKTLSDLQRLSEQMEDAINDMRGGTKDRPFIQRQQNILSRMLSAERALQKRGKSKKRQSETADQSIKEPPPNVTLQQLQKMLRKSLESGNYTQFTRDYQRIIQRYYELLNKR